MASRLKNHFAPLYIAHLSIRHIAFAQSKVYKYIVLSEDGTQYQQQIPLHYNHKAYTQKHSAHKSYQCRYHSEVL